MKTKDCMILIAERMTYVQAAQEDRKLRSG